MNLFSIEGKVVLITGASRGIGKGLAEGFRDAGAIVYGTGSRPESIEWMQDSGINGRACDVTSEHGMKDLLGELHAKHGAIDCLINNAGIASNTPATAIKETEMEKMIDTNFKGVFRACQAYYKLQRRTGGTIVNVASVLGLFGTPLAAVYSGTKAAVINMSRALAIEWAGRIRINVICPGFIDTDMTEMMKSKPQVLEGALKVIPMKRLGQPKDLLGAAIYLASEASSYMTGQYLIVDGGMTAQ